MGGKSLLIPDKRIKGVARHGSLYNPSRGNQISELEASLAYTVSSKIAKATKKRTHPQKTKQNKNPQRWGGEHPHGMKAMHRKLKS